MNAPADLIDLIYEAAAVPELWPTVLLQLCGMAVGDLTFDVYETPGHTPGH